MPYGNYKASILSKPSSTGECRLPPPSISKSFRSNSDIGFFWDGLRETKKNDDHPPGRVGSEAVGAAIFENMRVALAAQSMKGPG